MERNQRHVDSGAPATATLAFPGGERGLVPASRPNALWTIDHKGQFRTRDGLWCYPLTIVDAASRCLLACVAHPDRSQSSSP